MKPLSIKPLLLVSLLVIPWLQAQESTGRIRGVEQKVLLRQQREAVQAVIGAAGDLAADSASPDSLGKKVQWLTLVNNQISGGGGMPAANREEMIRSAKSLNSMAWSMITSPDAAARDPEVALKLVSIALDINGNPDPQMLDTKARALFLLGNHREAISQQEKAIGASTAAEQKTAFQLTLAAYRKNELPEIPPPASDALKGLTYITEKMKRIVIPSVKFDDVSVEEAVDFLRQEATKLDTAEPDPARKGINILIRKPVSQPASETAPDGDPPDPAPGLGELRIKELHLRDVPLAIVLEYICDVTRCRYQVDEFGVTLLPVDESGVNFSRSFKVPKDFADKIVSGSGDGERVPPFVELFEANGIIFAGGTSAALTSPDTLVVTNTSIELDKIQQLLGALSDTYEAGH